MGFDLVAFSGGKGLRGPQSAGLLLGRKDLIAAARLNAPPNGNTIGRGLKVNKEEMLGMLAALERYLATGSRGGTADFDARAETIRSGVATRARRQSRDLRPRSRQPRASRSDLVGRGGERTDAERRGQRAAGRRAFDRNPIGRRCPRHRRLDDAAGRGEDRRATPSRGAGEELSRPRSTALMQRLATLGLRRLVARRIADAGAVSAGTPPSLRGSAASRWRVNTPSRRTAPTRTALPRILDEAFDEVDRIDRLMSHYKANSPLSRINREAAQHPVAVDPELFDFIADAMRYHRESGGAFDITVGPLMKAWGFFRGEGRLPSDSELAGARRHVGGAM